MHKLKKKAGKVPLGFLLVGFSLVLSDVKGSIAYYDSNKMIKQKQNIPHCLNNVKIKYQNRRKRQSRYPNTQMLTVLG